MYVWREVKEEETAAKTNSWILIHSLFFTLITKTTQNYELQLFSSLDFSI